MKHLLRRTIGASAAALIFLMAGAQVTGVPAQDAGRTHKARKSNTPPPPPPPAAKRQKLPARVPFTAADEAVATVPGMPDARFWEDSETDFARALPPQRGALSIRTT